MARSRLVAGLTAGVLLAAVAGDVGRSDAASSCTEDIVTAQAQLDALARTTPTDRHTQVLVEDLEELWGQVLVACPTTTTSTVNVPTTTSTTVNVPPSTTTTAPPPSLLLSNVPGQPHEGVLHGVPLNYDWATRSTGPNMTGPTSDSQYLNLWGQVYHDGSNAHPANTRVQVSTCELWRLPASGGWVRLQGSAGVDGGSWREDFTSTGGTYNTRNEPDGTQSVVPQLGYNAHFWTRAPISHAITGDRAYVVACSVRLILANPTGVDDRQQARYLVGVGADWRTSTYGCPSNVCNAIGTGRHVYVTNEWRRVVYSSMSSSQVASFPALPAAVLVNPA